MPLRGPGLILHVLYVWLLLPVLLDTGERLDFMDEPAKNSIWNHLIPLWNLERVSSTFGRRGVEVSLTSHLKNSYSKKWKIVVDEPIPPCYYIRVRGSGGTADAHGSGPCEVTLLRVQIPSSAWRNRFDGIGSFLFFGVKITRIFDGYRFERGAFLLRMAS